MKKTIKILNFNTDLFYDELNYHFDLFYRINNFYKNSHKKFKTLELRSPLIKNESSNSRQSVDYFKIYANELITVDTKQATFFTDTMSFLHKYAKSKRCLLGRVSLTVLWNETNFFPHIDMGFYYIFSDRYHLVIKSEGSEVFDNGKVLVFQTGDLYQINNLVPHSGKSVNHNSERIHLIFDLFPRNIVKIFFKYLVWLFVYRRSSGLYKTSIKDTLLSPLYLYKVFKMVLLANGHS